MKELKEAELKAERDSIQLIEAYKKREKHVYRDIERTREKDIEPNYDEIEADLKSHQQKLYGDLLDIEINVQEALTVARKTFIGKISQILDLQKELTQNYITNEVMSEIDTFSTKFVEAAVAEKDRFDAILAQYEEIDLEDEQLKEFE